MALTLTLPPTPKQAPDLAGLYRSICVWTRQAQLSITQLADSSNSSSSLPIANSTTTGLLSSTDWNTFNNKLDDAPADGNTYGRKNNTWVSSTILSGNLTELTSAILTITGGTGAVLGTGTTIQVKKATTSQDGYLAATDWNIFNAKVGEAPIDGNSYARKNAGWVAVSVTAGNLTEATSSILTITGGTSAVLGSGTSIQVKQASGSQSGYLSSTDWTTFNGKQALLTLGNFTEATSSVLTISGGTAAIIGSGLSVQVNQASGSQAGYLSSTDWTTFNNKQPAGAYITDAPSDSTVYGRKNGTWVNTLITVGNLTETTSAVLTITGGTGAQVGSGTTIQVKQSSGSQAGYLSSTDWTTFNSKAKATNQVISIALCTAYTPPLLGADFAEVTVPFNSAGGSITFNITALRLRVQTAGGSEAVTWELSTASTGFSPTAIGSVSLGAGVYENSNTTSLGTIASGNKVRFNVTNLGTALNWTIIIEMNPT